MKSRNSVAFPRGLYFDGLDKRIRAGKCMWFSITCTAWRTTYTSFFTPRCCHLIAVASLAS